MRIYQSIRGGDQISNKHIPQDRLGIVSGCCVDKINQCCGCHATANMGVSIECSYVDNNRNFLMACKKGDTARVKDLLKRVDLNQCGGSALLNASVRGHVNVVKVLLSDSRVDPSNNRNYAIRRASENGHTKVVRLLINNKRFQCTTEELEEIIYLAEGGGCNEIQELLQGYAQKVRKRERNFSELQPPSAKRVKKNDF